MFDQVSLKRDGWHAKLQKWVFGHVPYENNFCPFFWLTIFCILAAPFVASYRGAIKGFFLLLGVVSVPLLVFEKVFDWFDKKYCIPTFNKKVDEFVSHMSDDDAYSLFKFIYDTRGRDDDIEFVKDYGWTNHKFDVLSKKDQNKYLARWKTWKKSVGDNWENRLKEARERWIEAEKKRAELREQLEKERQAAEARRRQYYAALVKYTHLLIILPIGVAAIYLVYALGLLGIILFENWTSITGFFAWLFSSIWHGLLVATPWVLGGLAVLLCVGFIVYMTINLFKKCNISIPGSGFIKRVASAVASPFKSGAEFLAMYFKTLKENHCPSIEWDE